MLAACVLGTAGSGLLALASNLPASPYGPHAGGLWPLAATGASPSWEGPVVPGWAQPANYGFAVSPARLLVTLAAVGGVVLLAVAWFTLWRRCRERPELTLGGLWWVLAAWAAPLLLAAPFASQDVWSYGAQGKLLASGFGASQTPHALGHSVWLSGVDPQYVTAPSAYGPGALDLSRLFVVVSGGHPWVAAELWRLTIVAALGVCAWAVERAVSARGGVGTAAAVAGVANPGVLVIFVAGVHNDAVMIGLVVAGIALVVARRPGWALFLCALAVTVKAPAALAVVAVGWWGWERGWAARAATVVVGVLATVALLAVTGMPAGGGFAWLHATSTERVNSIFSLPYILFGVHSKGPADAVEVCGIVLALALVLCTRRRERWVAALAAGLVLMAVTAVHPQPWYLLWALPVLACALPQDRRWRAAVVILCALTAWSELPLGGPAWGGPVWFVGLMALLSVTVASGRRWTVPGRLKQAVAVRAPVPEETTV